MAQPKAPVGVYLIADHLDAVLAAGEDLLRLRADRLAGSAMAGSSRDLGPLVRETRALELVVIARALQARTHARQLALPDALVRAMLSAYAAGTTPLADAVGDLAPAASNAFDWGNDPLVYLRSRGVLASDCGFPIGTEPVAIGEEFLVAGQIALGPLMDLAARLLDALDLVCDLFKEGTGEPSAKTEAA